MIEIRPAKPQDREALVTVFHEGWHDAHAALVPPEILPYRSLDYMGQIYDQSQHRDYYVALQHGAFNCSQLNDNAYAPKQELESCRTESDKLRHDSSDRLLGFAAINGEKLDTLFLSRQARGTGLAAQLLTFCERKIAQNGFAEAQLICLAGNERAERFYIRSGWVEDHRKHYDLWLPKGVEGHYTADSLCFRKVL